MSDEPTTYAIRFYERARRDIDATVVFLAENTSEVFARRWHEGIHRTIRSSSQLPERYAVAAEPHFLQTTRNLTWARPGRRVAHRTLYCVVRNEDGAIVYILHVRGATRAPITAEEAREIEGQQ